MKVSKWRSLSTCEHDSTLPPMKLPRLRLWVLMLLVALSAIVSGAWVLSLRAQNYRRLAAYHEVQMALYSRVTEDCDFRKQITTNRIGSRNRTLESIKSRVTFLEQQRKQDLRQGIFDISLNGELSTARSILSDYSRKHADEIGELEEQLRENDRERLESIHKCEYHARQTQAYLRVARMPWLLPPRP
jgi:HAMP domain-containing protein